MNTKWAGHPLHFYQELGSTNIQAKLEAEDGAAEGTLVMADMQTAGRGRRGRAWSSPAGVNLYFTLILKPSYGAEQASGVTLVMALAVAAGIREASGVRAEIKWPNDIVVNGRKVCGILTEMSVERNVIRYVVIGVGVNVGLQEFPREVAGTATSLQAECGREVSRDRLAENIMAAFEKYYESYLLQGDLSGVLAEYDSLLVNRGEKVRVLDPKGEYQGLALGINARGELLVEREDGTVAAVYAGEVSVRGIYGYV